MTESVNQEVVREMKVSSNSNPKAVAGAIAGTIREGKDVNISVIGAGAVNQAMKSVAIANGFLAPNGISLTIVPGFETGDIEGKQRTMMSLSLRRL